MVKGNICKDTHPQIQTTHKRKETPSSRRVESKVSKDDVRGAVRLLSSNDTLTGFNNETFRFLKKKHPVPSRTINFPEPPFPDHDVLTVSNEYALNHPKDFLTKTTGVAGTELLSSLTALCNPMLSGNVIVAVTNILYGANLCALQKKDGSVRPIAVGCTFRRIVSKLCCDSHSQPVGQHLRPKLSVKGGCKAVVHALNCFISVGTLLDNCIRIAIALRLGSKICHSHICWCGLTVNSKETHRPLCKFKVGKHSRHNELNDILKPPLLLADVSSIREPVGLLRKNEKLPDGMPLISWANDQPLVWVATCSDTFAPLNLPFSSKTTEAVAGKVATNKKSKYKHIMEHNVFTPSPVKAFGPWNEETVKIINIISDIITQKTGGQRSKAFLKQRIRILIRKRNAAALVLRPAAEITARYLGVNQTSVLKYKDGIQELPRETQKPGLQKTTKDLDLNIKQEVGLVLYDMVSRVRPL
ncbi:hypothetical protein ILUMI_01111 [Ignelater luminosus]|uniref:Uncharacterized protein n=1 Tax=Ignelater luminosus TaxID=2038154 RepID=A0A8K0GPJ3_IGNLU|nr:hypothetical protein ILUMI_01111 [Ignelater luminosus]